MWPACSANFFANKQLVTLYCMDDHELSIYIYTQLYHNTPLITAVLIVPCLFEEKRGDIVFGFPWFRGSVPPLTVGTLCAQLLLQVNADLFETLHVFFVMVWRYAYCLDIIGKLTFITFFAFWT